MRKIVFIILYLFISLTALAEFSSPSEAIRMHREWMRHNCPKPESLNDEQLMLEAANIIDLRLQEDEAFYILAATAKKVPEVMDYINWTATLNCDTLFQRKRNAFRGMLGYLDKTNHGCYGSRKLRNSLYNIEKMFRDLSSDYEKEIKVQEDIVAKNSDKKEKALLLLMKLNRLEHLWDLEQGDNPLHYSELWQLEREVLKLYPPDSVDVCEEQMELYVSLGSLKCQPSENLTVMVMLGDENPYDNGTLYNYTGKYGDYLCNSGFYFQKAAEISEKIYGPWHPATAISHYFRTQFSAYFLTMDEDTYDNITSINEYFTFYYPKNSNEACLVALLKGFVDFRMTGSYNLSPEKRKLIEDTSILSYGEHSNYYLNTLLHLTCKSIYEDSDFMPAIDRYLNCCREVFPDNHLKHLLGLHNAYSQIKFRDPAIGAQQMESLKSLYIQLHDGSPQSYYLGVQLADYYSLGAFDFKSTSEIYKALTEDTAHLFGHQSAMYYKIKLDEFNLSSDGDNPDELNTLNRLITEIVSNNFKSKDIILRKYLTQKGMYLFFNSDFIEAHKVFGQVIELASNKRDVLFERCQDALCRLLGEVDTHNLNSILSGIEYDIAKDSIGNKSIASLISLGTFYRNSNNYEKSINCFESALNEHNFQTNNSLDDEYFQISSELSNLYDITGNVSSAARIVTSDREALRDSHRLIPSTGLADYLFNSFFRASDQSDLNSAFFYLGAFQSIFNQLYISSGNSDLIKYNYGVKLVRAAVQIFLILDNFLQNNKTTFDLQATGPYADSIDKGLTQLNSYAPQIKSTLEDLLEGFPQFDSEYRTNINYRNLLISYAIYHKCCEHDYDKAEEYFLKAIDLDEKNSYNLYLGVADVMQHAGKTEKQNAYLEKAYSIMDSSSSYSSDKMNLLAYKFIKTLKNNDIDSSIANAREIYLQNRKILDNNFQLMSSVEQERFFNTHGDPAWALVTLLEHSLESLASETYNAIIYRTGIQLRSQQEVRKIIEASSNPTIRNIADSIATLKSQLKQIVVTPDMWFSQSGSELNSKSSDIQLRIEHLEITLLDLLKNERSITNPDITWEMIRNNLKPGQAAIEFIQSDSKFVALVLKPGCKTPISVPLGKHKDLTDGLTAFDAKNSASLASKLYAGTTNINLYSLLWEPLESELSDCKTIYFSAPGILHTIAFNAIRTPDGNYLMDKYDLRQLTTTAQLTLPSDNSVPKSAALLGDVLYDPSQAKAVGSSPELSGMRAIEDDYSLNDFETRGISKHYFRYLPFTGKELVEISNAFGKEKSQTIVRADATEQALRKMCTSNPEVLHLATHGFFISSDIEAIKVPYMKRFMNNIGSAMQRSGVALANAEISWKSSEQIPEENDGILTASEVAKLNLRKTRLVTLSACETALGDYNFEGVHGLTRGFKQAGAQSLLVSLWSVNDASTALFMTTFYREWIRSRDRHAAYRSAMTAVRTSYPSPFYWAPFILLD